MNRYPRDMLGYGATPPDAAWPDGAAIAVQFVVNYEEGGENSVLHGDAASEAFLSEITNAQPWPGMRHWNMESIYEYGARAGFWRLHRLFSDTGIPVTVYGVATALFGLSTSFALSYILFGLTGAGDTVSTVIRGTLRQLLTPDHLRGRMTSVNMVFFMGGPQLGELEAGLVASLFGAPVAIFTGGVATVLLTALIAWRYPRLRNYTSDMADDLIKQAAA